MNREVVIENLNSAVAHGIGAYTVEGWFALAQRLSEVLTEERWVTAFTTHNGRVGVWLIYEYDHGPYAVSIHPSAEEAARRAAQNGYGKVGFWPFGTEFAEAVNKWDAK